MYNIKVRLLHLFSRLFVYIERYISTQLYIQSRIRNKFYYSSLQSYIAVINRMHMFKHNDNRHSVSIHKI